MSSRITAQASIAILVVAFFAVIVPSVRSQRMAEPLRIDRVNRHFSSAFDNVARQYRLDDTTRKRVRSALDPTLHRAGNEVWDRNLATDRLADALRESPSTELGADPTHTAEFSRKFMASLAGEIANETRDSNPPGGGGNGTPEQPEHSDHPDEESSLPAIIAFLAEHWFVVTASAILAGWVYLVMRGPKRTS